MSRPLYPRGKRLRYSSDRRLGGPQNRSGRLGEEKILDPTGTRTPNPPSSQLWLYGTQCMYLFSPSVLNLLVVTKRFSNNSVQINKYMTLRRSESEIMKNGCVLAFFRLLLSWRRFESPVTSSPRMPNQLILLLLQEQTVSAMGVKFPAIYKTGSSTTLFARIRHDSCPQPDRSNHTLFLYDPSLVTSRHFRQSYNFVLLDLLLNWKRSDEEKRKHNKFIF
jgi:hypothetical protein